MLDTDLPACICGAHTYQAGGGHFGGNGSSQWFTCEACGRQCIVISHYMTVLVLPTTAPVRAKGTMAFPQDGFDYINGALDITMRAYGAEVEAVRKAVDKAEWDLSCDLLGLPRGTKIELRQAPPGVSGRYMRRPDGSEVEDPTVLQRFDAMRDRSRGHVGNSTLLCPLTPPKMPACLTIYVRDGKSWQCVDRTESAELEVPPDPRRRAHDWRFGNIFASLRAGGTVGRDGRGIERSPFDIQPVEIPNQYYDDRNNSEPWYTFQYGGRKFTVGPRKRVLNITIESEQPFATRRLRVLAERDDVTYDADDVWKSKAEEAKVVTIHAWGAEKFVEYLATALEGTR